MINGSRFRLLAAVCVVSLMAAPGVAQEKGYTDKNNRIDKCTAPYGTLAVNEPTDEVLRWLRGYQLESPSALIRIYAQESNCFIVVERGRGMQNVNQERALAASGELQQGSNMGKGQMVAADYVVTPYVQFSDNNAGGVGGVVGGLGRRVGGLAAVAGGLKFKEAQTSLTLASVRTSVQVASAEGKAKQRDFSLAGLGIAGGLLAGAGAYSSTAEGKVIAASLLDNYNAIVMKVMGNPALRMMSAERVSAVTGAEAPTAGATFAEGDVIHSKIDGVKLMATASDTSKVVATLKKTDELVIMGVPKDGYVKVLGAMGEGFVKTALIIK